jgi:hypothetical protein
MPLATPGASANAISYDLATVWTAVTGSAAPTDTTTSLNAAFKALGLLSEDNVTLTFNQDRTELHSMGGITIRVKRTGQSKQFAFTAIENSHQVFTVGHPGSTAVTATGITTRTYKAQTTVPLAMVVQANEGSKISRFWCPSVEVFSEGDQVIGPTGFFETPMTAIIYPDSAGILHYEITDDPAAAAS